MQIWGLMSTNPDFCILRRQCRLRYKVFEIIQTSKQGQDRVKLWRCGSAHHEGTWGSKVMVHFTIASVLNRGEWSSSRPGPFNPGDRVPDSQQMETKWEPEPVLEAVVKRKISFVRRTSNLALQYFILYLSYYTNKLWQLQD